MQNRSINNWEYMEKLWEHTFVNELRTDPKDHPVLITEPHDKTHPSTARERTATVMFETHGVPVLRTFLPAVLALFGSGRTTGAVLDSGLESSSAVAIDEGTIDPKTVQFSEIGGKHLTDYLIKLWTEKSKMFTSKSERVVVEDMKRKFGRVVLDINRESNRHVRVFDHRRVEILRCLADYRPPSGVPFLQHCSYLRRRIFSFHETHTRAEEPDGQAYTLPDGRVLTLGDLDYRCPEAMFDPIWLNVELEPAGMHELVYNSIYRNHKDIVPTLYGNVFLCGGNTRFPGMQERMMAELATMAPPHTKVQVRRSQRFSAWIGGSILTSLQDFPDSDCITKEEFQESGPGVVHRKRLYVRR